MKKLYTSLLILATLSLNAQVIENPGFEEWENLANGNPEPVNWSSTQSADPEGLANLAPQVLFKDETDPHSGTFSLRLKNVSVPFVGIVSNGIATNGRVYANVNPDLAYTQTTVSDPKWYTECTTRPDSLVGYYKYAPQGEDFTFIQALLHTGSGGKLPDANSTGWVALAEFEGPNETISEWTRFSTPFNYLNDDTPEYILFNISSGNRTSAVAGSQGWYDDLELVYNVVGLDENIANDLLNVYARDQHIVIDMRKFGAGEVFDLEIYSVIGQLILSDQAISGYTKELRVETGGVYICTLKGKDGLILTKKVFVE